LDDECVDSRHEGERALLGRQVGGGTLGLSVG
jgi:hypothetical protein